jgi:hypothetical protein
MAAYVGRFVWWLVTTGVAGKRRVMAVRAWTPSHMGSTRWMTCGANFRSAHMKAGEMKLILRPG